MELFEIVNKGKQLIEILIEPSAEYIDLLPGETAIFEIESGNSDYNDPLKIEWHDNMLVVFEQRHVRMKIYINKELKFSN